MFYGLNRSFCTGLPLFASALLLSQVACSGAPTEAGGQESSAVTSSLSASKHPACDLFATGTGTPNALAVTSTGVYWVAGAASGGTVQSVNLNGGSYRTLASGLNDPYSLAVTPSDVYFSGNGPSPLMSVGLKGGPLTTLAETAGPPNGLAANAQHLFYFDQNVNLEETSSSGSPTIDLVPSTGSGDGPVSLANGSIYYGRGVNSTVSIYSKSLTAGATPSLVYTAPGGNLWQVIATGSAVYFAVGEQPTGLAIMRVGLDGSAPSTLVAANGAWPSFTVDGSNLYWINAVANEIWSVPVTGGTSKAFSASSGSMPTALAADSTYVYWANSDGTIHRLPKL